MTHPDPIGPDADPTPAKDVAMEHPTTDAPDATPTSPAPSEIPETPTVADTPIAPADEVETAVLAAAVSSPETGTGAQYRVYPAQPTPTGSAAHPTDATTPAVVTPAVVTPSMLTPTPAASTQSTSTATSTPVPPPPARRRGPRLSTIVWGLLIALIGIGMLGYAVGFRYDMQLAFIIVVAAAGLALVLGGVTSALRRRT